MSEDEKEVKQTHSLSYEFERKTSKIDDRGVCFKRPQPVSPYVKLIQPSPVQSYSYEEPEEPTSTSLQKIQKSVQGVQQFSGRLGAAFNKRAPQIGILDNNKRKTKVTSKKQTKNLFGL